MSEFDKLKMSDPDTVDDYAGKLSGLASRAAALGEIMEASKLNDAQGCGSHSNSRGRCRGIGYGGRGRGQGRSNVSDGHNKGGEASDKTKKDYSKVRCWRCDKMGYFVSHCPTRPREEANLTEIQEADALYMNEVVFLNEERVFPKRFDECDGNTSIWYLDNGASSITFIGKTGERRALKDIYYITSLKHNIISLGQATEMGCEVNMKEDLLMLKDPRGRLVVQVARQPNRLHKTPIEVEYPKCLQIQETDVTWTWHARLGHVNFGVMKNKVDKEMVAGMP
ncbi:PREDICTED: uncharacterized protein LOC106314277 [Brassica oleracea var. oleracea]|uniref:uncharacterized protein LOC106314277 n=1 Tax=Brassica oleracea var. oleracea TaxID=109376 RepID=UPI0006A75019|nr:PREDICTED: uncharacterized protein LOC106314277 [Brassica oleracea var. oleracea]